MYHKMPLDLCSCLITASILCPVKARQTAKIEQYYSTGMKNYKYKNQFVKDKLLELLEMSEGCMT